MKQKYIYVLKEFNISQKQGSSHYVIVRDLLHDPTFILETGIIFTLNNINEWNHVFSIKVLNTPQLLQKSWRGEVSSSSLQM